MVRTRSGPIHAAALAACACLVAGTGCAGGGDAPAGAAGPGRPSGGGTIAAIDVAAETTSITEGETVRIVAAPRGGGPDGASIDWITTGGTVTPDADGRSVTARFERSGTYTVTARLLVAGAEADRDSATIEVAPGGLLATRPAPPRAAPAGAAAPARVMPASAPAPAPPPAAPHPAQAPPDPAPPDPTPDDGAAPEGDKPGDAGTATPDTEDSNEDDNSSKEDPG